MKIAKIALIACAAASFGFGAVNQNLSQECIDCTGGDLAKKYSDDCVEPCGKSAPLPPAKHKELIDGGYDGKVVTFGIKPKDVYDSNM